MNMGLKKLNYMNGNIAQARPEFFYVRQFTILPISAIDTSYPLQGGVQCREK